MKPKRIPCEARTTQPACEPLSTARRRERVPNLYRIIRQLAEILNAYRISMGNPQTGVMFHSGDSSPLDLHKLAQRVIRPVIKSIALDWYGCQGFRRGIASNLYDLAADEKVVQRILRHAKPHVTKERYIKTFDPTVLAPQR